MSGLDEDVLECQRLLSLSTRPRVRTGLLVVLHDLQQENARSHPLANGLGFPPRPAPLPNGHLLHLPVNPRALDLDMGVGGLGSGPLSLPAHNTGLNSGPLSLPAHGTGVGGLETLRMAQDLSAVHHHLLGQASFSTAEDGGMFAALRPGNLGVGLQDPGAATPGFEDVWRDARLHSSLVNAAGQAPSAAQMGNLGAMSVMSTVHLPPSGSYNHSVGLLPTLPPNPTFRMLTTCSWEQNDSSVKVYVPLRGVQTELLRSSFSPNSLEVKVFNLQGKNHLFVVAPTHKPIVPANCVCVASKTKKNILITMQKASNVTPEERHWRNLHLHGNP